METLKIKWDPKTNFGPLGNQGGNSETEEVYPLKLYHPDDPPRPCQPKASQGLVKNNLFTRSEHHYRHTLTKSWLACHRTIALPGPVAVVQAGPQAVAQPGPQALAQPGPQAGALVESLVSPRARSALRHS